MPYKDKNRQREYQRKWMAKRRSDYLADEECVLCGSTERLEIDHVDPSQKISHRIWSWTKVRREAELAKCVVKCHDCHLLKSKTEVAKGEAHGRVKFTEAEVRMMYAMREAGMTFSAIGEVFGVKKQTTWEIIRGQSWKHLGLKNSK